MGSRESSGNSSRLSLDVANLPLIPFGMKHQGSARRLHTHSVNRFSKLSRRRGRDIQESTGGAKPHNGIKENLSGNSSQHRKRWPAGESRVAGLRSVPEDGCAAASGCTPAREEPAPQHSKNPRTAVGRRPLVDSAAANRTQSTGNAATAPGGRRDSVFTDIDDGSFVEFCDDRVPGVADDPERKTPLYYTCDSNIHDTQYSTSTKTNTALVGFRKYLDKLRTERRLGNLWEESETEETRTRDKENDPYDETIITCSADIQKLLRKGPPPAAINSTVRDKLPVEGRHLLPCVFSEISTLTVQPEIPDSRHQSGQSPQRPARHQIIVLSDSSEDEESRPGGGGGGGGGDGGGGGSTNVHHNARAAPRGDNADEHKTTTSSRSPALVPAVAGKCPSLISEDVSIVSISRDSRDVVPRISTGVVAQTAGVAVPCRREDRVPVMRDNRREREDDKAGAARVTQTASVKPNADKQFSENGANPVHKWVMTSPFKESSFDCSFLQKNEDSFISESPSQPKVSHKSTKCFESGAVQRHSEGAAKPVTCTPQGAKPRPFGEDSDSSVVEKSVISDEDGSESECEFAVKRSTAKEKVIVSSTSEDSGDDRRNGMYVTQRRKKKPTNIFAESHGRNYTRVSESKEEESFRLRLPDTQNETNKASEKTTQTVGKTALSPEAEGKIFSRTNNQRTQDVKDSIPSCVVGVEEKQSASRCPDAPSPGSNRHHSAPSDPPATPSPRTQKYIGDSDRPMDLSLIRKELDNLYTSEWRKKEDVIFKAAPREEMQEDVTTRPRKPPKGSSRRRRSRSCPRLSLESEEESSFLYKVSETSGDSDDEDASDSDEDRRVSNESNRSSPINSADEKTAKTAPRPPDSPEEDSFEEYLKKAKVLIQQKQQKEQQRLKNHSEDEDEDRYESSFINDDSSDDESYYLPPVTHKAQSSSTKHPRTHKHKGSDSRTHDRGTGEETHKSSEGNRSVPSASGEKTTKTTPSSDKEDSFEEYLKRVRVLTQQKKNKDKVIYSDESENQHESSFFTDDNSDDDSYSLPSLTRRPRATPSGNPGRPEHKNDLLKKPGIGTTGISKATKSTTTTTTTTAWRDSPTVTITSDSDSDEFYSLTERNRKTANPPPSYKTPRVTERGKAVPKTEGHRQHFPKTYEGSGLSPRLPFLASLSSSVDLVQCHPDALPYVRNFKKKKEELAGKLYKYYNGHVFDGKLPSSMNIKWNARLTKTAGYCYYQVNKSAAYNRGSRIELSTKVIDCCERLRDTLIHELCHAAAWIISGYKDGHGPLWRAWAAKARAVFPELPAINRCHNYQIQCKYTYRCIRCSYSIGRHSKSLDTNRKVCGLCYGKFELVVNSNKDKGNARTPASEPPRTPRTPGPFALFVKENYGSIKKSTPNVKHGDVMKILSAKFERMKTGGNHVGMTG